MNGKPLPINWLSTRLSRPVQDQWRKIDPEPAGMKVAMSALVGAHTSATQVDEVPLAVNIDASEPDDEEPAAGKPSAGKSYAGAVYALEFPTQCPHCAESIRTIRVLRLLRTQVSFTSTLPRKGYVIVCPECERLISAELSGLI